LQGYGLGVLAMLIQAVAQNPPSGMNRRRTTRHQLNGARASVTILLVHTFGIVGIPCMPRSEAFSALAPSRGALLRQVAALIPGTGAVWAPAQGVLAEEVPQSLPQLKPIRSKVGRFEMQVPETWRAFSDQHSEKLLFAYDFYNSSFHDYMAMRAEQIDVSMLLREENYIPSEEDKVANAWSTVIQPPITPEQVATWIMRRATDTQGATLQGLGGREVIESEGKTDTVIDVVLPDGGKSRGEEGSELLFHFRTVVTPVQHAPPPARRWVNKALLRNGTITVGYVTATENHWLPGGPAMDGAYLDNVANTLRFV